MKSNTYTDSVYQTIGINDVTSYCKLASIQRFGDVGYKTKGNISDEDIHGNKWGERVILVVTAYDRTTGKVAVKNPNGLEWITDVSKITFCNKNGIRA